MLILIAYSHSVLQPVNHRKKLSLLREIRVFCGGGIEKHRKKVSLAQDSTSLLPRDTGDVPIPSGYRATARVRRTTDGRIWLRAEIHQEKSASSTPPTSIFSRFCTEPSYWWAMEVGVLCESVAFLPVYRTSHHHPAVWVYSLMKAF